MAKTIYEIFDKEDTKSLAQINEKDIKWLNNRIKERIGGEVRH
ncbi:MULTISPECIES: hypothetical protein [unclassified Campylobacter]|nr:MULTISPECIES: hypothetical protein [unclassified Campylobacter]